ncbi:hypothetical protein [Pontibacillus marinus]|uniref:Uracil-DNA glycosylase-like domain-containing protein n=1 Tax=Pontibacillus marinus BH030004 = DSM 16465 TaxID=1385511 RepID=A0A0A5GJ75_9BACI|nr:hypothetical protein [Pontibacillus marinus]KGX91278.1 hypothetical protein N783_11270 [Pontibacillus marinus BH030004 = DSM 16465]
MSITSELNVLYERWKNGKHFIPGGVVDENKFQSSSIKVLMLLKEVNDTNGDEWTLPEHLNNQIHHQKFRPIWRNVGMWVYGAQFNFPPYQNAKKHVGDGIRYVATTNLKKSGGSGSSNMDEIWEHARDNQMLWREEIKIINPDIVVCGGTFSVVKDILGLESEWTSSGAQIGHALDTIFIDFYHPAYRVSPRLLYPYFKETVQSLF